MDERAITGAVIAAVFVGVAIIGRVAVARFVSTRAATFIALLAIAGLIGLAAGGAPLFEQIAGQ